ncbi:nucleoside-diphosphate sugar epimerase/dehydratase [uncultured Shimia sp.]|uniref:polysaccharide biosynthesis protein n=1 Tax=uncultured Shimia sp. TaxID=573152 RepID=UPI00262B02CA|nr:nucleoside-diphosphate sugar epimerase/dehydratase [uncultured Shimia sp.]
MTLRLESVQFLLDVNVIGTAFLTAILTVWVFWLLGLYRNLVRCVTGGVLLTVGKGALISLLLLYASSFLLDVGLPRSVPLLHAVLVFLTVGGLRFFARQVFRTYDQVGKRPVIIFGAGEAGLQLLNALYHGPEYQPVALVDDNETLQNLTIGGLPVLSPHEVECFAQENSVQMILLALPSVGHQRRREIVESLEDLHLEIKTIPGISEIISGKAKISELRTVSAEDLLGRDPVAPDSDLLRQNVEGKVVMISGAGGSIGSELCRQILSLMPETLVLYEMSEFALYAIENELSETAKRMGYPTRIAPVLGSVQHARRLDMAIQTFGVQTIYHAAAYKHVPLVEENVIEGIRNNVFGTLEITNAARKHGVESFILISTDKAVRPTNIMGSTKRIAELICQAQARESGSTVFSMVRFGNVLGSSGSVIPRFSAQIEKGGPVTLTHLDITRYFMTIPEASQLVIQAGAMAKGGDVFVLDMGEPVKILDLAMSMVKLHGLKPYLAEHPDQILPERGDIPICVTGLRKGEKLYEELLIGNDPAPTRHPRIMTASEVSLSMTDLRAVLGRLFSACERFDLPAIIAILHELPVDYRPTSGGINDVLWREREIAKMQTQWEARETCTT